MKFRMKGLLVEYWEGGGLRGGRKSIWGHPCGRKYSGTYLTYPEGKLVIAKAALSCETCGFYLSYYYSSSVQSRAWHASQALHNICMINE